MTSEKQKSHITEISSDLDTSHVKLPLLISVPHGGYTIPLDLQPRISIDLHDIFPDSDPCTRQIYAFENEVYYYHDSDTARAVIDLNRTMDDLPPANPDGVIKSHTIMGKEVYRNGCQPDTLMIRKLLHKYYLPYHRKLTEYMEDTSLLCGLDCHSMLEFLPDIEPVKKNERPFICLGNCGDEGGEGDDSELTCHPDLIQLLADCLRSEFPEEAENIVLNTPFRGGHISRFHSKDLPWIQIELNRRAYLRKPWFDPETLRVEKDRLEYLRNKFLNAFIMFCDEASNMQYMHYFSGQRSNYTPMPLFT